MYRIALEFANGRTLYYGLVLCGIMLCLMRPDRRRGVGVVLRLGAVLGAILVLLSAAPFPILTYVVWVSLLVAALWARGTKGEDRKRFRQCGFPLFLAFSVACAAWEVVQARAPVIAYTPGEHWCVIGDSLSMGADSQDRNWPGVLGKRLEATVDNFSAGGSKVRAASSSARLVKEDVSLVLLEIGGNDLFYDTPVSEYDSGLRALLEAVRRPGRRVVMFELPLPPFYNRYGRVQRAAAKEYGVVLIPKHVLAGVIGTPGATLDGLHFSHKGHDILAQALYSLVHVQSPEAPVNE